MSVKDELIATGVKASDWTGRRYNYPAEAKGPDRDEKSRSFGSLDLMDREHIKMGLSGGDYLNHGSLGLKEKEIECVTVHKKTFDARLIRVEEVLGEEHVGSHGLKTRDIIGRVACFEGPDGEVKVPCEQLGDIEFVEPTAANIIARTKIGTLLTVTINYSDVVRKLLAFDKAAGVVTLLDTSKGKEETFEVSALEVVKVA